MAWLDTLQQFNDWMLGVPPANMLGEPPAPAPLRRWPGPYAPRQAGGGRTVYAPQQMFERPEGPVRVGGGRVVGPPPAAPAAPQMPQAKDLPSDVTGGVPQSLRRPPTQYARVESLPSGMTEGSPEVDPSAGVPSGLSRGQEWTPPRAPIQDQSFTQYAGRDGVHAPSQELLGQDPTQAQGFGWKDYLPLIVSALGAGLSAPGFYGPSQTAGLGAGLQGLGQGFLGMREAERARQAPILERQRYAHAYRVMAERETDPGKKDYYTRLAEAHESGLAPDQAVKSIPKPTDPLKKQTLEATLGARGAAQKASEAQSTYKNLEIENVRKGLPPVPVQQRSATPMSPEQKEFKTSLAVGRAQTALRKSYDNWKTSAGGDPDLPFESWLATDDGRKAFAYNAFMVPESQRQQFMRAVSQANPLIYLSPQTIRRIQSGEDVSFQDVAGEIRSAGGTDEDVRGIVPYLKSIGQPAPKSNGGYTDWLKGWMPGAG